MTGDTPLPLNPLLSPRVAAVTLFSRYIFEGVGGCFCPSPTPAPISIGPVVKKFGDPCARMMGAAAVPRAPLMNPCLLLSALLLALPTGRAFTPTPFLPPLLSFNNGSEVTAAAWP